MKKNKQKSAHSRLWSGALSYLNFRSPKFRQAFVASLCLLVIGYVAVARWRTAAAAPIGQDSPDGIWRSSTAEAAGLKATQNISGSTRVFQLDDAALTELLRRAPMEFTGSLNDSPVVVTVPSPDGAFNRFRLQESPIMEPALAAKFPEIKTYLGQGVDEKSATVRCDLTPHGFHATVFSVEGTYFVEPVKSGARTYRSHFKEGQGRDKNWQCFTDPNDAASPATPLSTPYVLSGATLRTYRLALAATGEYTAFQGGTVPLALAAMVTSMNRVNGVYEREVGVRMIMVANNDLIVYTNAATDPYTNTSGSTMLGQNQTTLDSIIGTANYDIGHVFSTGGGGVASLRSVCVSGNKARGVTGSSSPTGDGFDIDYVAHEMGHQFGGNHTFNGTTSNCGSGNRSASAAYEPGSGTTIMAYAGICGAEDIQPHSDAYFHVRSLEEILAHITGTGNCAPTTATGNSPPTVSAGTTFTIPQSTPFTLTASGTDPDGDALAFCWEQFDLGTAAPPNTDNGSRPIFRSFTGTASPSRTFPQLADILSNTATLGESFPLTTRALNFRVTARDNRAGGGGVRDASVAINVRADSGPFVVTAPNTAVSWAGGSAQNVTWDVANTTAAPVSCAQVNILLSTDGGNTFPITLLAGAPNNGTASVVVPNLPTTQARVKIAAAGNIFFDISNANFTITAGSGGCSYALNPTAQNFAVAGGANTVNVTTGAGCVWTAISNAAWISINGGASGTGSGTVNYSVAANAGGQRSGTMTIAGQDFIVTQDGIGGGNGLQFYPLPRPVRLLDTRAGQGNCDAVSTPITGGASITLLARATCEGITIPANAQAIVGNITAINQTSQSGFLTLFPTGQTLPLAANMVYEPGGLLSNNFTVGLNASGQVNIFAERTIHAIVDISGYYAPPGQGGLYFHPLSKPIRLLDTRAGQGNCDSISSPIAAGTSLTTIAAGRSCEGLSIPATAQAIAGNATVINGSGQSGFLTIYPDGIALPLAANMIYLPGSLLSNAFTVGLSSSGKFNIFGEKTIDMVVDVAGYYSTEPTDVNGAGLLFNPLVRPLRILDTRAGQGNCDAVSTPIPAGTSIGSAGRLTCEAITIPVAAQAIIGNVTVINGTASAGFMTMYPDGLALPLAANMVYFPGQLLSNAFVVGLNPGNGQYRIFGERTIDAIVDASGFFAP